MPYILPILMRYRYRILAALSLLLISEMAVVVGVKLAPVEYQWAFTCLVLCTMAAWTGIVVVIGYGPPIGGGVPKEVPKPAPDIYTPDFSVAAPVGGDVPKHRAHIILVISPALFVMFVLLSVLLGAIEENLFQSRILLDIFWQPYSIVLVIVWIGTVVIAGAIANVEASRKIHLVMGNTRGFALVLNIEKIYLVMGVFPLLVLSLTVLCVLALVLLAQSSVSVLVDTLGFLLFFLSTSLAIGVGLGVVLRRSMSAYESWIAVGMTAFGISMVSFVPVMLVFLLAVSTDTSGDRIGAAVGAIFLTAIVIPVLWSLINSVFLTMLIGTVRRPTRSITLAGIGVVPMILLSGMMSLSGWNSLV